MRCDVRVLKVWTMSGGIRFDNVLLVDSEEQASEFAQQTWKRKKDMEKAEKKVLSQEERLLKREEKRAEGGLNNMIEVYLADSMDFVAKNQYPVRKEEGNFNRMDFQQRVFIRSM